LPASGDELRLFSGCIPACGAGRHYVRDSTDSMTGTGRDEKHFLCPPPYYYSSEQAEKKTLLFFSFPHNKNGGEALIDLETIQKTNL